ncbi:MAG: polysaccharide biosynthesis protein [Erysipelotrichaceae bacterium]|nr:polysaccharide biosynthesis protein [Erysipelotrichaceae bacterium]MBQ7889909.1 polysaccharide biosynthesis protein [Erysipelotrichaceae bacterium]
MKKVMFISSTGGHLTELLQLKPMFEKTDYTLVTEKTKSNEVLVKDYPGHVHYLAYGTKQHLLKYLFIFTYNCILSFFIFLKVKPDAVITTGTHTAVPMCYIAHFFKKKVIYIETFANSKTPTQAGRLVYPIADLFVVQWESMLEHYPNAVVGGWIF